MRRRHEKDRGDGRIDIPIDSFGDIAFLLIIFFILVTSLHKTLGMLTDLPAGEKSQAKAEKTPSIDLHNGQMKLNDKETTLPALRASLAAMGLAGKSGQDKVVLLEATGKVAYQQYYEVMTAISKAGGVVAIVRESEGGEK